MDSLDNLTKHTYIIVNSKYKFKLESFIKMKILKHYFEMYYLNFHYNKTTEEIVMILGNNKYLFTFTLYQDIKTV